MNPFDIGFEQPFSGISFDNPYFLSNTEDVFDFLKP